MIMIIQAELLKQVVAVMSQKNRTHLIQVRKKRATVLAVVFAQLPKVLQIKLVRLFQINMLPANKLPM